MNLHGVDRPSSVERRTIHIWFAVILLEAVLVTTYFVVTSDAPSNDIRYLLYPFLWINAGLWAVARSGSPAGNWPHRVGAAAIAGAYLIVILYLPGKVGFGTAGVPVDLRVEMYAPGWGPLVAFTSPWLRLFLIPFEVLGYASLAFLLYVNLLGVTRGALSGVFGLVTCVGCSVPILVPLVGMLGGPATSLTTTAYEWSYDLGTLVFLLTVGLLYWGQRRS